MATEVFHVAAVDVTDAAGTVKAVQDKCNGADVHDPRLRLLGMTTVHISGGEKVLLVFGL